MGRIIETDERDGWLQSKGRTPPGESGDPSDHQVRWRKGDARVHIDGEYCQADLEMLEEDLRTQARLENPAASALADLLNPDYPPD